MQVDTFELVEWALSCRRRAQRKLVFGRLWALVASASVSSQQSISWWGWHHCLSVRPLIWKKSWTWSRESGNRVRLTGTSVAVPINSVTASDLQNKILLICFCLSDITQFFLVATISLNHMVYSRIWVSGKCSFNLVRWHCTKPPQLLSGTKNCVAGSNGLISCLGQSVRHLRLQLQEQSEIAMLLSEDVGLHVGLLLSMWNMLVWSQTWITEEMEVRQQAAPCRTSSLC